MKIFIHQKGKAGTTSCDRI